MSAQQLLIDDEHPWPGLSSFTEAAHGYFHGRDEESDALLRLVRRTSLSVLFGQSGLGKSSLLHAGLFPRLRQEDCLPVSIRLDLGRVDRPLADQVREALRDACDRAGAEFGAPIQSETLWEHLHSRDGDIWSTRNRLLTPVLVFDQFEELFTLGRRDADAAMRVDEFLADLADVIEQRMPQSLVDRLDADPSLIDSLAIQRPVKLVLSFREDHLADIESLRTLMPSVMHNRMRLARMTAVQARQAIVESGRDLVTPAVAERVIAFVARANVAPRSSASGPAMRVDGAEIEPALLSVVCRELNNRRIASRQPRLTTELLDSGAPEQIIQEFYRRSFEGVHPAVQAWVEDRLLTSGGFRNSEAVEDALQVENVDRAAIDKLIARRLLRLDDRLGVLRVELTHDLLTQVARESRDLRARTRAAAELAARDAARRRRLRIIIGGSLAIGLGAFGLAVVFYVLLQNTRDEQRKLVRTQGQMLLAQARVGLERGIPGEPAADLAMALRQAPDHAAIVGRAVTLLSAQRTRPRLLLQRPVSEILAGANAMHWRPTGALVLSDGVQAVEVSPTGERSSLRFAGTNDDTEDWGGLRMGYDLGPGAQDVQGDRKIVAHDAHGETAIFRGLRNRIVAYDLVRDRVVGPPVPASAQAPSLSISPERGWIARQVGEGMQVLDLSNETARTFALDAPLPWRPVRLASAGKALLVQAGDQSWHWAVQHGAGYRTRSLGRPTMPPLLSSNGRSMIIVRDRDLMCLEWTPGGEPRQRWLVKHELPVLAVDATPDHARVATGSLDRSARVFAAATGSAVGGPMVHHGAVAVVKLSPDGRSLVTGARDGAVRVWRPGEPRPTLEPAMHGGAVIDVAVDPVRRRVAALSADGRLSAWEMPDAKGAPVVADHVTAVAASPDGRRLAAGLADGSVVAWSVPASAAGTLTLAWQLGRGEPRVSSMRFSVDGETIAVGRNDGSLQLHAVGGGVAHARFMVGKAPVRRIAWSASGGLLAVSAATDAVIWDVKAAKPRGLPLAHNGRVEVLKFSPDELTLASAEGPAPTNKQLWSVRFWDAATTVEILPAQHMAAGDRVGHLAWRIDAPRPTIIGGLWEEIRPWSGAESADGKVLFGGGADGLGVLVSSRDGSRQGAPMRHDNAVLGADFSPDGRWLVSRAADGLVRLWDRETGLPVADPVVADTDMPAMLLSRGHLLAYVDDKGSLRSLVLGLDFRPPAPDWLPTMLELAYGTRLDARGAYSAVTDRQDAVRSLRARLQQLPDGPWRDWGNDIADGMLSPVAAASGATSGGTR